MVRAFHYDDKGCAAYLLGCTGHFSGSICGTGLSGKPSSTIAFERRWNPMLALERRKGLIVYGMWIQALGIGVTALSGLVAALRMQETLGLASTRQRRL